MHYPFDAFTAKGKAVFSTGQGWEMPRPRFDARLGTLIFVAGTAEKSNNIPVQINLCEAGREIS